MPKPKSNPDQKSKEPIARITIFLKGETKRLFFEEMQRTGVKECHLGREIIILHYRKK